MPRANRTQKGEAFVNAYRGNSNVEVIPSSSDCGENEEKEEYVGAYCRVSTMSLEQVESYELQKNYYEERIARRPNWNLVGIYADEGISATSMKNRKSFNKLIQDCKEGKITLIITKSVSRFARNVVDAISTVRMLRNLPNPVAVYFETENINSLSPTADSQLSLLASFAESESLNKSASMKWAIRSRFAHGIPKLVDTYGLIREGNKLYFDLGDTHTQVVKWMYFRMYKYGSVKRVLTELNKHHIPSPLGKEKWCMATVLYILTNEKYCGNVLMQKTIRKDMFTHRSIKNTGQERKYLSRGYLDALIPWSVWMAVQLMIGRCDLKEYMVGDARSIKTFEGDKNFFVLLATKESIKQGLIV